jgi:hypothetical protein
MSTDATVTKSSNVSFRAGWVLTVLLALLFGMSATMKLVQPGDFAKDWPKSGLDIKLAAPIGIVELACVVVFLIPQTAVLGAILLTGYLGGAVLTHLHVNESVIPPVVIGILVWIALYLRDPRLRKLAPLRSLERAA